MAFPARCMFTVFEVSARLICGPLELIELAISGEIDLVAGFPEVRMGDKTGSGLLGVPGCEVRPLFRPFGKAAKKVHVKQARLQKGGAWMTITDPVKGVRFAAADIMITAAEVERFEHDNEINRARTAGPGAPGRYDWDGFYVAMMKRIFNLGLPATQTILIHEMQEWFIANSADGCAPDESTIRPKVRAVFQALTTP